MRHVQPTVYLVAADAEQRKRVGATLATIARVIAFGCPQSFLECSDIADYGCVVVTLTLDGMTAVQFVRAAPQTLPVVVLGGGGDGDIGLALELMRAGAADYIDQAQDPRRLRAAVLDVTRPLRPEGT